MSNLRPYTFHEINMYESSYAPSTVHVKNTALAQFFKRYLLQEAMSVFDFTLPKTWDKNYFLYVLYVIGYIAVFDTPGYGVIPQHCGLGGYTVFYQPAWVTVANPLLPPMDNLRIGEDCEVIKLEPDYCGLYDIVDYYGDLMALTAETMAGNILNSKLSYVFGAENKATSQTLKKLYDAVASGEPAQFVDKELFRDDGNLSVTMFQQNVGQNFIADKLLDAMTMIRNQFLTDIGIPNVNVTKQSGVSDAEVQANDLEVKAKTSLWMESLQEGFEKVRKHFHLTRRQLDVKWRQTEKTEKEDEDDETGNDALDAGTV